MDANVIGELARQTTSLSGILAALAFAVVIQLIALSNKHRISAVTVCLFIACAALSLVATAIGALLLIQLAGLPTSLSPAQFAELRELQTPITLMIDLAILGLVLFYAGLMLVGWIHSSSVGVFADVLFIIGVVFVIFAFVAIR